MNTLTLWLTRDNHENGQHVLWVGESKKGLRLKGNDAWDFPAKHKRPYMYAELPKASRLKPGDGPVKCELRIGVDDEPRCEQ